MPHRFTSVKMCGNFSIMTCLLLLLMVVLSHVWLFVTPWTVTHQNLLFMGFPRQEYWSSLPFPPPGDLPDPGIKHTSTHCPSLLHCRRSLYSLSHLGLGHYKIQSFSSAPCSLGKVFIFSPSPYCWKTYLELPQNWVLMLKCTPRNAKIMCKRKKNLSVM